MLESFPVTISVHESRWSGSPAPRIGVDSYSYHRYLGEIRPGELDPHERWDTARLVNEIASAGAEVASLETCYLDHSTDLAALADMAGMEITLAWGHRDGLEYGRDAHALADALQWIDHARSIGIQLVRVVAASPWVDRRPGDVDATIEALTTLIEHAGDDVQLALENHADLTADELVAVLDALPGLALCLDTANALRVGADPVELARRFAPRTAMVHVKDVATDPFDGVTGPRSCVYGDGVVDLDGVLAALDDGTPGRLYCVELGHLGGGEVDERQLVAQCLDWLSARLRPAADAKTR